MIAKALALESLPWVWYLICSPYTNTWNYCYYALRLAYCVARFRREAFRSVAPEEKVQITQIWPGVFGEALRGLAVFNATNRVDVRGMAFGHVRCKI